METRNIKITPDTARRLYEQGVELKEMALGISWEGNVNEKKLQTKKQ